MSTDNETATAAWKKQHRRSGFWDLLEYHVETGSWITIAAGLSEERASAIVEAFSAAAKLRRWEAAMTDVSVINWTLSEDNAEDLHKQLIAVIAENVKEQLDPTVSEQAAKLRQATDDLILWQNLRPGWDIAEVDKALQEGEAAHNLWRQAEERIAAMEGTPGQRGMQETWELYRHQDMGWYVARSDIETDSQAEAQAIYVSIKSSGIELRDRLNAAAAKLRQATAALDGGECGHCGQTVTLRHKLRASTEPVCSSCLLEYVKAREAEGALS